MGDDNRPGDLPGDLLFHPEYQDKYVAKLRELARQHGQDLFLKQAAAESAKTPPMSSSTLNPAAISPTPSTSSNSSCNSSNIRHFKKALILQSNMEDGAPIDNGAGDGSVGGGTDGKSLLLSPGTAASTAPESIESTNGNEEANGEEEPDSEAVGGSELSIASADQTAETNTTNDISKVTDFSITSLSGKCSSEDEVQNRDSLLATDQSMQSDQEMKDDSLKAAAPDNFDFRRPSTSALCTSLSTLSIPGASPVASPSPSQSPSPCPSPSPNASFTTLPQMPAMVTHVGRKPLNGPPCSLKTLVDDNILDPLDGSLTYEILGSKFMGDLLPNGFIRMSGTSQVFANPSSWANYCRSTIASCSKDQKNYGSAWSIIRYLGKRLDSYKLRWYRKQKKQYMGNGGGGGGNSISPAMSGKRGSNGDYNFAAQLLGFQNSLSHMGHHGQSKSILGYMNRDRLWKLDKISTGDAELNNENLNNENEVVSFASLDLEHKETLAENTKVGTVSFSSCYSMQPFLVTVATNVLLLVDFHSHLTTGEASGYLGGTWDPRTLHLTVNQAYPLFYNNDDDKKKMTKKIRQNISQKGLIVVGWYHSHSKSAPQPTVRDIKRQLQYQKQMLTGPKGLIEYTPVVGLISSPYYPGASKLSTLFQMFWVMPLYGAQCRDFGRPMQMSYSVNRDAFLTQDLLVEMRMLASHYNTQTDKFIKFNDSYREECTYWEKLHESLKPKLPRDLVETHSQSMQNDIQQQALMHFWTFLRSLLLIA